MVEQYDIIGDIHGHADELEELLTELGYNGSFVHPENHQVIFLGDFIDRGVQNERVITIVRTMVDRGSALAVMGNHEYNALCYHTLNYETQKHLRVHSKPHTAQHQTFLDEFHDRPDALRDVLQWIITLPMYLEIPGVLRAIHACWDQPKIDSISSFITDGTLKLWEKDGATGATMTMKFLFESNEKGPGVQKGSRSYELIETLMKGPESALFLPNGEKTFFLDKGDNPRFNTRLRWFGNEDGDLRDLTLSIPDEPTGIEKLIAESATFDRESANYYHGTTPVFFGHYWMIADEIDQAISHNAACIDYSIAKDGHLAAYKYRPNEDGGKLDRKNYSMIKSR